MLLKITLQISRGTDLIFSKAIKSIIRYPTKNNHSINANLFVFFSTARSMRTGGGATSLFSGDAPTELDVSSTTQMAGRLLAAAAAVTVATAGLFELLCRCFISFAPRALPLAVIELLMN